MRCRPEKAKDHRGRGEGENDQRKREQFPREDANDRACYIWGVSMLHGRKNRGNPALYAFAVPDNQGISCLPPFFIETGFLYYSSKKDKILPLFRKNVQAKEHLCC